MRVRAYKRDDCEALSALFFQTVREVNIRDYSQTQVEAWAPEGRCMETWRRSFDGKSIFVAEEHGKIAGFGVLETNGHIDRFYVDAASIGIGVGKMLYREIERDALTRDIRRLFVEASITAKPFFCPTGVHCCKGADRKCSWDPNEQFRHGKVLVPIALTL